jgi:hypothetical protein
LAVLGERGIVCIGARGVVAGVWACEREAFASHKAGERK